MRKTALGVVVGSTLLMACGGKAGDAVRPKDITAAAAMGTPTVTCVGEPKLARPLVVDLDSASRTDLEVAMKRGVVFVAYDCKSLRVLPTCKLGRGNYEYVGASRREDVVHIKNQDDLSVNLPLSAGKLGGSVSSGNSIDLALVLVGQRTTTVDKIDRPELTGDACAEATHFVQSANLGAFSMAKTSAGQVVAVADLFKVGATGSSSSDHGATATDGSLDACRKSDSESPTPPGECHSPISLQLYPIAAPVAKADKPVASAKPSGEKPSLDAPAPSTPAADTAAPKPTPALTPCPTGFVLAGGICTHAAETAHLCQPQAAECKDQCEKGSAGSCYNWAASDAIPADDREGYYKKACDGGSADGCGMLANFRIDTSNEKNPKNKDAIDLAKKGCAAGGAVACDMLGWILSFAAGDGPFADVPGAVRAYERACGLGHVEACSSAGFMYWDGKGVPKDQARAVVLMDQACSGGEGAVCPRFAQYLMEAPPPTTHDADRALRAVQYGCKIDETSCFGAVGVALKIGKDAEAFAMASSGCDRDSLVCETLGDMYAKGRGTTADPAKAKEAWKKTCAYIREDDKTRNDSSCQKAEGKKPAAKKGAPKKKK